MMFDASDIRRLCHDKLMLNLVVSVMGIAGHSDSMLSVCKTIPACKPVRALQGGIQSNGVSPVTQR
jgi:hypothetical protein